MTLEDQRQKLQATINEAYEKGYQKGSYDTIGALILTAKFGPITQELLSEMWKDVQPKTGKP